jgi:hypothetical protein
MYIDHAGAPLLVTAAAGVFITSAPASRALVPKPVWHMIRDLGIPALMSTAFANSQNAFIVSSSCGTVTLVVPLPHFPMPQIAA